MIQKRIVVLESKDLLSAGIYSLLSTHGYAEILSLTLDREDYLDQMARYEPEVVIMDERVLARISDTYAIFLRHFPNIRTIVLNLGTNSVKVCEQRLIHVEHVADFLEQI